MFHLDYLSCFLTVLATILLARKSWIGLLIAIVNSLIVCVIGLRTSQLGFIPANLFCICAYAFSMRSWLREQTHTNGDQARQQDSSSASGGPRMSPAMQHRTTAGTATDGVPRHPSNTNRSRARERKPREHKRAASRFAAETVLKVERVNLSTPVVNGSPLYRSSARRESRPSTKVIGLLLHLLAHPLFSLQN
jgi:hypothetical protein